MKKVWICSAVTAIFAFTFFVSAAQNGSEAEIRTLENQEGTAWVNKDTATLFKLFSPDIIVNTPINRVANLEAIKKMIRTDKINISSSEKLIDQVRFVNGMAVVMGHDIVTPQGAMEYAGKKVTRQYTDIWIKEETGWKLTIRQATITSIL